MSEQTPAQNNNNLVDRRLARRVGADYNSVRAAMLRLQRNPNPKLLPARLLQHYSLYMSGSVQAATNVARQGSARYFAENVEITNKEFTTEGMQDPPMMLVLKRAGIRVYPDGKRIALYNNDKLGIAFSIPYVAGKLEQPAGVAVAEEVEEIMENIDQISKYASEENPKSTSRQFKFADGSTKSVAHGAAKAIHMVHGALKDPKNQKKFADMLQDPNQFDKAAHFALNKVEFKINK